MFWENWKIIFYVYSIKGLFSTRKKWFSRIIWPTKIFISMQFLNEVLLLEALDAFKNFQTSISCTKNLNFWFISIGSDFSKSETWKIGDEFGQPIFLTNVIHRKSTICYSKCFQTLWAFTISLISLNISTVDFCKNEAAILICNVQL